MELLKHGYYTAVSPHEAERESDMPLFFPLGSPPAAGPADPGIPGCSPWQQRRPAAAARGSDERNPSTQKGDSALNSVTHPTARIHVTNSLSILDDVL